MQAALYVATPSSFPSRTLPPTRSLGSPRSLLLCVPKPENLKCPTHIAAASHDISTVDYSSITSVFPAEACEVIGGEACEAEIYPEVKLRSDAMNVRATTWEPIDREYLDYNDPKTVFLEEACDDLGGEFCEPEYKTGL